MTAAGALRAMVSAMMTGLAHLGWGGLLLDSALSLGCVALAVLASRLLAFWLQGVLKAAKDPAHAERHLRMRRLIRLIQRGADLCLVLAVAACVAVIWGASRWLLVGPGGWLMGLAWRFVIIGFVTFASFEGVTLAIHHGMDRLIREAEEPRRAAQLKTLSPLLCGICQVTVLIFGALTLLSEAGVRIGPLLAGAGVAGIAVGFGAQSVVKDVLTGIFLIAEDIVSIGDVVQISGSSGVVEQMTLRTIRLRGLDGTLHVFPYGEAQVVHNMTKTFAYYVFNLQIAYEADVDKAFELIKRTGETLMREPGFAERILEPIEVLGVDALGDSGVVVKARIKTKPLEQWTIGREYNRRIKRAFDDAGIEIPYPHMKLVLAKEAAR